MEWNVHVIFTLKVSRFVAVTDLVVTGAVSAAAELINVYTFLICG